ncbi:hypothetical protein [Salinicola sp. RZ23]|uniref:hypothetical protein n=1 Tax=Salinicola sp. RZ23 TaxID=1949087 RepID=UPI000DA13782|nr:hypothetical protein [Salinicola sp. RZ23]
MKEIRCPACHTHLTLEQICEDESLRELMGVLADLPREVSRPLVAYLGLFRGKSRSTAYERQLRLAREALALAADTGLVGTALSETVEAIRAKRDSGENRPLTNHNYLKRVLESLGARAVASSALPASTAPRPAKGVARALAALDAGRQQS